MYFIFFVYTPYKNTVVDWIIPNSSTTNIQINKLYITIQRTIPVMILFSLDNVHCHVVQNDIMQNVLLDFF